MNSNIKQYLKEVSATLSCPKGVKSVFLRQLKSDILAFADNSTVITVDELYRQFGTPEEIAAGFFDRDDYSAMLKKAKRRANIWMCLSIVATVLFIVTVIMIIEMSTIYGGDVTVSNPI